MEPQGEAETMSAHALANDVPPNALPPVGTILADAYRVDAVLGNGGKGVILAATEMAAERRVAIKIMTASAAADPEQVARFRREAKAAACLTSNHVVRVLDFGELESGLPYLVMEHLQGTTLLDVMRARGPLPVAEAVDYVVQAIHGVAEAHARGIIHRDLKPANLFVTGEPGAPLVKVLDFGASKLTAESSVPSDPGGVTLATSLIGSPRYMAPEQIRTALEVDARADIYALGATLHELLSGNPIFFADTLARIFALVLWEPAESLCAARGDVPPALDAVVMRCLAKVPAERYATVEALAAALSPFATTVATLATAATTTPSKAPTAPPPAMPPSSIIVVAASRRRRKLPEPPSSLGSGGKLVTAPAPKRTSLANASVVLKSTMKMRRVKAAPTAPKKTMRMAAFALAAHLAPARLRNTVPIAATSIARTALVARYRGETSPSVAGIPSRALLVAIAIAFALVLLAAAVLVARRMAHAQRMGPSPSSITRLP